MKVQAGSAQKRFWKILPLHYWTGSLAGMIWVIWLTVVLFLQANQWRYEPSFLVSLLVSMLYLPVNVSSTISNGLMMGVPDQANGASVYLVVYHWAGYIIPFFLFVAVGIFAGKILNVPERAARKRRLIVLLAIAVILWSCWVGGLLIGYPMWAD